MNERIRVPQVRLIDEKGTAVGIVAADVARSMASRAGLDLVEVSPNAVPPVCRIMDYGKYKFEIAKKARASKSKQHVVKLKEIKLHPKTDDNDFNYRVRHAIDFLEHGCKVKVILVFRGREMAHLDYGKHLLDQMCEALSEAAVVESRPPMEGNSLMLIFAPSQKSLAAARKRAQEQAASGKDKSDAEEGLSDLPDDAEETEETVNTDQDGNHA